jgi:exodeoxyribonuclease V alpha subunit
VFNGDVGIVERIDAVEQQVIVRFDERPPQVTGIGVSSGLQRNLIYTSITRGKKLVVLIGQKKALGIAVRNDRPQRRYSGLLASSERSMSDTFG